MSDLKEQFKLLAKIMVELEETTVRMCAVRLPGMPLRTVDLIAKAHGLSVWGERVLVDMISQSEKICLSDCQTMLVPRTLYIEAN